MSFESEDKYAWENSEVMNEFERIAQDIYDEADESILPIKLAEAEETFEDEVENNADDAKDKEEAEEIFSKLNSFSSINKELFDKIRTISYSLADRGLKKEAFKIERVLRDLNGRSK